MKFYLTIAFMAAWVLAPLHTAQAVIRWQTTTVTGAPFPAAAITDQLGNPLPSDPGPNSVNPSYSGSYDGIGYFVQLIWAGPNGQIDLIRDDLYVPGVSIGTEGTDDVVIDTSFIGRGRTGDPGDATNPLGHIVNQGGPEVTVANGGGPAGQTYYIRAFNAPVEAGRLFNDNAFAPVVGGGLAPSAQATYYGNSNPFVTSDSFDGAWEIFTASPFSTNILLVPEAGTAGLVGFGMLLMRRFLRRRQA